VAPEWSAYAEIVGRDGSLFDWWTEHEVNAHRAQPFCPAFDQGLAVFDRLRYRRADGSVFLYAFDLLELDGGFDLLELDGGLFWLHF
jgi:hypothetical protein